MPFTPYHLALPLAVYSIYKILRLFSKKEIHWISWISLFFGAISPDIQGFISIFIVRGRIPLHGFSHTIFGVIIYSLVFAILLFTVFHYEILKDMELNFFSQFLIFSMSGLIFHLIPDMIIYIDMRVYWPFSVISYGGLASYENVASFLFYLGSIALLILLIPLITQARKSARWNGKV